MICLSRNHAGEIFRYLEQHYPHEACGVFFGRRGESDQVTGIRPIPNLNTERAHDRFEMDPRELLAAEKEARAQGLSIIGVYHSHPDHPARPSTTDLERAWGDLTYMIVSVREGKVAEWTCWLFNEVEKEFHPRVVRLTDGVVE